jgi:predicted ATP-grasp superfamily ATP-dependent carboligase
VAAGGGVVLQEWIRGSRESVSLLWSDGRARARFAQVAQRMFPPLGGSSVVRESIPLPRDLTAYAERLVGAMNFEGYAEVEFRRDASGRGVLMEINPRLSASVELAVRAGVDFPRLLYAAANGEHSAEPSAYRTGLRMRWLGGDIRWLRATLAGRGRPEVDAPWRAVVTFAADFLRPARYDYIAPGDLRPAVTATVGLVAAALERGRASLWSHT